MKIVLKLSNMTVMLLLYLVKVIFRVLMKRLEV